MKFLANENFPAPSVFLLRTNGIDIKSVQEDAPGITDAEVIALAQRDDRIILTFDKDYGEMIFRYASDRPPAVIFFRFKGASPLFAGDAILAYLNSNEMSFSGVFTVVEEQNIRQRKYST